MFDDEDFVNVTFTRFDAQVGYTCPRCGAKRFLDLEPDDVYTLLEGLMDGTCDECGAAFHLTEWGE